MKAYLGNALFSKADRDFNESLAVQLRALDPSLDLYVPQENMDINDKSKTTGAHEIARADTTRLTQSDFLIAILDGTEIDSGLAAEIGAFSTTGKPIFALCTDIRYKGGCMPGIYNNPYLYRNLFVVGLVLESSGGMFNEMDEFFEAIKKTVESGTRVDKKCVTCGNTMCTLPTGHTCIVCGREEDL